MTKANLIDQIAQSTERTKEDAEQVIDAVLTAISEALENGDRIDLRGFGSFQVSGKKERQGRNPKTGEALTIAARNVVVFKPSKELAERVNKTRTNDETGHQATPDSMPNAHLSEGSAKVHGDKIDI